MPAKTATAKNSKTTKPVDELAMVAPVKTNKIATTEFVQRIKDAGLAASKLTEEVQALALSSVAYVLEDGNASGAAMLCNALADSGARTKGLALYLMDHCPITLQTDKETGRYTVRIDKKRRAVGVSLDKDEETGMLLGFLGEAAAERIRWDRYSVENQPKPFDFDKAFTAFMKKIAANSDNLDAKLVAEKLQEAASSVICGFGGATDPVAEA